MNLAAAGQAIPADGGADRPLAFDFAAPGRGCARLEVELVAGESTVTSVWAASPLKILTPRSRGPSVWAYLSSYGGGMLAGDEISVALEIGDRARCFFTTQASTKIYRNPAGRPCSHTLSATVGENAILVHAPDPVQAFAGASYRQRQEFRIESSSGLVLVDWLSAGRVAQGERWAFNRFSSRNDVFIGGERVMIDSLLLDPDQGPIGAPQRMGRFNCLAMLFVAGDALRDMSAALLAEMAARPVEKRAGLIVGASPVAGGALLRFAGEDLEQVGREIHRRLAFVGGILQDDPWARKW